MLHDLCFSNERGRVRAFRREKRESSSWKKAVCHGCSTKNRGLLNGFSVPIKHRPGPCFSLNSHDTQLSSNSSSPSSPSETLELSLSHSKSKDHAASSLRRCSSSLFLNQNIRYPSPISNP
eukprot:TRINITY_DN2031_c1_g1_i10.p1 TRINITY_DN2031_c1_g1~~TRINITY_DN2031_c1_g1_i10.p1  ORF type:complete len:121 (+),score=14.96 TRINITY_DN2031_c1_g1_i10:26-388(+)